MKNWLLEILICPECLSTNTQHAPLEIPLTLKSRTTTEDDIIEGELSCPQCKSAYAIHNGVAVVVPARTLPITRDCSGYGSFSMLSSYLWSHFSEFFSGTDAASATDAYRKWATMLAPRDGWALDIGCSVGRLTLEMSNCHTRAVGIDTSHSFISAARRLCNSQRLEFEMIVEGRITQPCTCPLEEAYRFAETEFIVADAMALPFRSQSFVTASSVNILEKVPDPQHHLREANRIMAPDNSQFLFSDPFSWDESVSSPDLWLGGHPEKTGHQYSGFGIENICRILEERQGLFAPGLTIHERGEVLWKIRKTRNLWEHITSQFVIARRSN